MCSENLQSKLSPTKTSDVDMSNDTDNTEPQDAKSHETPKLKKIKKVKSRAQEKSPTSSPLRSPEIKNLNSSPLLPPRILYTFSKKQRSVENPTFVLYL